MNEFVALIKEIQNEYILNITHFSFFNYNLKMISLELNNFKVNNKVILQVKPINVMIGKNINGILSFSNKLKAQVIDIKPAKLLSCVYAKVENVVFECLITKNCLNELNLEIHDEITLFIKESDLSIKMIYD